MPLKSLLNATIKRANLQEMQGNGFLPRKAGKAGRLAARAGRHAGAGKCARGKRRALHAAHKTAARLYRMELCKQKIKIKYCWN